MSRIVFDIETVGEEFAEMDETTKESITKRARKESADDDEFEKMVVDLESGFALSPLTGEIVAIGVLDADSMKGAVYFQAPESDVEEFEENGIKMVPMSEAHMLSRFWELSKTASEFIGFNSRGFDAPFLMARSVVKGIRPSVDLMSDRYGRFGVKHIDLYDQLSFYGASRFAHGSLHMWCRALGIKSPKEGGVKGDDVGALFKEGRYLDIAKYNIGDVFATKELYDRWDKYLRFS
jgi:DNA polymerase elongation subunit (family B)